MPITNFFWDGDSLLQEYDDAGNTTAQYSTEPGSFGNITSQRRGEQSRYYHHDPLGSTTELTNASGDVTDTRRYKAFGETVEQTGSTTFPFQYVGRVGYYFDAERATHYVRRRDLQSDDGRWLSEDPRRAAEERNGYIYASNRPTTNIDPRGEHDFLCWRSYNDVMISAASDPDTGEPRNASFRVSWKVGVVEGRCGIISDREGLFEFSASITPLKHLGVCDPAARAVFAEMHDLFMQVYPRVLDGSGATMDQGEANRLCSASFGPITIDGCRGVNYRVTCSTPCDPAKTCGLIGASVIFAVYRRYGTGGARPTWEGKEVWGRVGAYQCGVFFNCACGCEMDACGVTSREILTRVPEDRLPTSEPIVV
jgi:RHS repeat-associated protein